MKKIKLFGIIVILLFSSFVYASDIIPISLGEKTSDAAIITGECRFFGGIVLTDGTNDATVICYDNASAASGTKIFECKVSGALNYGGMIFPHPEGVLCYNGVYMDIDGTGASFIPFYNPRGK